MLIAAKIRKKLFLPLFNPLQGVETLKIQYSDKQIEYGLQQVALNF